MSAIFFILLTSLFQTETLGCFLYDIDYKGTNLNAEHQIRTEDAATCQKMCQKEPQCYFWTWATPEFHDPNYRKDCYLKANDVSMASDKGLISGPKNCGQGTVELFKETFISSSNIRMIFFHNFSSRFRELSF